MKDVSVCIKPDLISKRLEQNDLFLKFNFTIFPLASIFSDLQKYEKNSYREIHTLFWEVFLARGTRDPGCAEAPSWSWTCEGPIRGRRGSLALRYRRRWLADSRSSLHSVGHRKTRKLMRPRNNIVPDGGMSRMSVTFSLLRRICSFAAHTYIRMRENQMSGVIRFK